MDDEAKKRHEANRDPNSHMRPGGIFDPSRKKASKILVVEDIGDISQHTATDAKQTIRRQDALTKVFQDALTTRVTDPGGDRVLKVSFAEFERIRLDPEFSSLAQYSHNLILYADGTPRPTPIRALLENEMGMYRDKIVVLTNNPGDQYVGTLQPVAAQLVHPDPFPSEPTAVTKPDIKVLGEDE